MLSKNVLTFIKVAQNKSFTKAANVLFISPVSVMKQINALEADLQVSLFNRNNHGVHLTQEGKVLYASALKMQIQANETVNHIRLIAEQQKIIIKLGASLMRPAEPLINVWRKSKNFLDNYNLKIISFSDAEVTQESPSISIGKSLDCIVGPCDANEWEKNYNVFILGYEKFKIAVPIGNQLEKESLLTLQKLDKERQTLIIPPRSASIVNRLYNDIHTNYPNINLVCTKNYFSPNTFSYYPNNLILTRDSFTKITSTHTAIPVNWDYVTPYGIIYAKNPSKKITAFIESIRNNC